MRRALELGSVGVLACAGVLTCGGRQSGEATGQARSELEVSVSRSFDVEAFPNLTAVASSPSARLACGSLRCMVFYGQSISGKGMALASRVTKDGHLVDAPRIVLGNGSQVA